MENKKNIKPILRAIVLILALMPLIEISARRAGGRGAGGGGARMSGQRSIARPSSQRSSIARPTSRPTNRPSQQPGTRPNAGARPGQPANRPNRPDGRPGQPTNRTNKPDGRLDHRPIVRPGRRPINIYAGGYGYGGYYNGYYDNYGYDTAGSIKYAILDKTRGSAPDVYCSQACSEQQGLNWNGNSWCDETACYCECSI